MNERGLNPFKKNINNDHLFLTGAGMGIGKLMALRFGKLGCKLSLADINFDALEETA
jgi:NADP-dependent 3-hydroxy acid dehydrogenase YdfG